MDTSEKVKLLEEAFGEKEYQEKLQIVRGDIEKELKRFIDALKSKGLKREQRIFDSMESRIKDTERFSEKIVRKNYISKWKVSDWNNRELLQNVISMNFPDLIGYRIMCFFKEDEEPIYNFLREYDREGELQNLKINFNEGIKEENGETLYKVTGLYKGKYSFELQIKSMIHNMWGEVEHKAVYKSQEYAINKREKTSITNQILEILKATDKQLVELYNTKTSESKLTEALFFMKTHKKLNSGKGVVFARNYERFFNTFGNSSKAQIRKYVAYQLLDDASAYKPSKPCYEENSFSRKIKKIIESEFESYDVKMFEKIASYIYKFDDEDDFLGYMSYVISESIGLNEKESDFSEPDESEENFENGDIETVRKYLEERLTKKNGKIN